MELAMQTGQTSLEFTEIHPPLPRKCWIKGVQHHTRHTVPLTFFLWSYCGFQEEQTLTG